MAKQLNVNLAFQADTSNAEANIRKLQQSLTELSSIKAPIGTTLTKDMQIAVNSAKDLQTHLNNAFNVKTGNFDLKALNTSLKNSGQSLSELTNGLLNAGLKGEQAFMNVQKAIASSSVQINQAQGALGNFLTTLKNTARWQISSSILHGFMGSIQSAYRYAQDLDKSLNNIRIVTGQNADQMARFAEQANKAAKELSATTTDYTNASLIYYQQGLDDKEVAERTNVTIKMANAAGESAQTVSDQMTAVWNNFDDGSKSLEYYADVMTALGAATASSTSEISEGLEKFAAVAETVGLSYEYATAALATVTATTRQSADVVGTAFKTLFARIQDLELGETLDDGTTLGQYSQALAAVGVNIKDTNGEIKEMDIILEEIASKWNTLAKDQQIALAQSVAGVRQYTQLIALMDNWDFMQKNLNTAYGSEGTLQEQADIYAESWEAARDRVKASMETLYNELIPTDFIIDMNNAFGDVIDVVGEFTSAIGGLPTILMLVANIMLNKMGPSITNTINSGISSVQEFGNKLSNISLQGFKDKFKNASTGTAELINNVNTITNGLKDANQQTEFFNNNLKEGLNSSSALAQNQQSIAGALERTDLTKSFSGYLKDVSQIYNLQGLIEQSKSKLTTVEQEQLSLMQQQVLEATEQKAKEQEILDTLIFQRENLIYEADVKSQIKTNSNEVVTSIKTSNEAARSLLLTYIGHLEQMTGVKLTIDETGKSIKIQANDYQTLVSGASDAARLYQNILSTNQEIEKILQSQITGEEKRSQIEKIISNSKLPKEIQTSYTEAIGSTIQLEANATSLRGTMSDLAKEGRNFALHLNSEEKITRIEENIRKVGESQEKVNLATHKHNLLLQKTSDFLIQAASKASTMGGMLSKAFSGMSTIAMGINSVSNAFKTLKDEDASFGQKLTATTMGLTMGFNALKMAVSGVGGVLNILQAKTIEVATVQEALSVANAKNILTEEGLAAAKQKNTLINSLANAQNKEEIASILTKIGIKNSEAAAQEFLNIKNKEGLNTAILKTLQNYKLAASEYAVLTPLLAIAAAVVAVVAVWKLLDYAIVNAEESLEQAKNQAKETSEALNEAKDAANELKSAFDNYREIRTSLDDCIEGTEEWTEALKANNQEVLKLLQKYPQLAEMEGALNTTGGVTTITDKGMEELQKLADQSVSNTQVASTFSNQKVRNTEIKARKQQLSRDFLGVDIATTDNNSNEDVQALVKEFITDNAGEFANLNKESQKELLNKFFTNNNITSDASLWVDAIDRLRPDIAELAAVVNENTAATEAENVILANNLIGDNEKVNNSQFANEIGKVVADGYDDAVAKEIQALEDSKWGTKNISQATGVNQAARDVFKTYAEAAGITNYDLLDTKGSNKNRKFVYDDGNGEKTVSLEAMKAVVAAANASEKLSGAADKLVTIFDGRSGSDIAAITAASTGNVNDLTLDQLEGGFSVKELADSLSDEDLEALGITRDEFIESLTKTIDEGSNAFNDLADDYVKTVSDTLIGLKDSEKLQELTVGETQALADTLNTAFINGGSEATQKISEMFGKTGQDADEFADVLTSVDWQTTNVDDLNMALSAAGVTTHFTAEELQYLIDTLKDTSNASLEVATSQYAALHKIVDGIQAGDTISAEDFDTLGEEYRNYFMLMADGTYKLTGDAEEFYKAVNEKTIEDFKEVISSNEDKISNANNALSRGVNALQYGAEGFQDSKDHASAQINFLSSTGFGDTAQIQQWNKLLEEGTIDYLELRDAVNDWTDSLGGAEAAQNVLNSTLSQASWEIYQAEEAIASTATSTKELNQMFDEGTIGVSAYFKAWEALNTKEDLEGLDPEELKEYSDYLQEVTSDMEGFNKEMSDSEAQIVAKGIMKMNDAIETLSENFDGWKDVLKKSTKTSEEYADAITNTREAVSDLLDVSSDYVEDDFIIEHLEDIEKAATGDAEAIDNLKAALAQDIIANIVVENELEDKQDEILAAAQALQNNIPDIEVGASIDTSMLATDEAAFLEQCQKLISDAQMTADQANAFFDAIGFEPTFKTELQPVDNFVPEYTTETAVVEDGTYPYSIPIGDGRIETIRVPKTKTISKTYQSDGETMTQMMEVPALGSNGEPQIEKITRKASGSSNNFSSSNKGSSGGGKSGGGSGSSNTKKTSDERQSKSDVVERYKEINDQLDITAKKMDDASEIADTLYGSARIKKMREVSKTLQQEISLLEQKNAEAKKYLSQDKTDLNSAASTLGIGLSYGANGEITNIEDAQTKLFNKREALLNSFGNTINDSEQKLLEALDKKIETFEKALEQYEDTRKLRDELDSEILNKRIEWQENNFDIWEESLELNLEVNDNSLNELERKLEDLEDDFYSMAEAAALMVGEVVDGVLDITGTQLENYTEMTTDLAEKKTELDQKYINGSITQADYIEGLKTLKSEAEENSDNIKNLDDAMIHYYGDTLQAAQEELSQYTDLMSQHTEILEHYVNIMDIIGESTNYKKMGVILEGQAKVAENTMKVSKANYEMLNKQREARKAEYEAAMNSATDEELEVLKQKWLDAETAANDAQDQMIADTEAWAESLKAVLENKLAGFAQELENTLTGEWGSFDQMTAAMDRASSLQEEYLTNTNKIYETNKLMNKAQQDLDKTTNSVAKKRLQAYIDETEQLQNQAELSNYELEIQQAKYDLILAEIALEEAQAAKSTVRLQRDSEGNFGYVYTADSSEVAQAQQDLEDAQNSLYNIGLEGANDYSSKYQQTLSEMYDTLTELQEQYLSGVFESEEEYNNAVAAAKEYYYEKLKQYSSLYQVALTTDSAVIADAWSSDFSDMMYSTEEWKQGVESYLADVGTAFSWWEEQVAAIREETIGPDLDSLRDKVEDITTENEELTDQLTKDGGLIDALEDEIEKVNDITTAYAGQRTAVLALKDANNALITSINGVIAAQANTDNDDSSDNKEDENNNDSNNNNNNPENSGDSGDSVDFSKIKIGSEVEVESGSKWYYDSYGAGPAGNAKSGTIKHVNTKGSHPYNIEGLGWIKKSDIRKVSRYNTGGYTGDWGPEGKLGILDEKELVLNQGDTANFLASMELLNKIVEVIDLQALNSQIGGMLSSPSFNNTAGTLEQNVYIEASFPNAVSSSEIEEAFNNIINQASQYANK